MKCALLNIGCHLQSAVWEWWANIGLLNKFLIIAGIVGIIVSASMGILRLVKQIGGWPGVIAALALILGVVLAVLPKPPKKADDFTGEVSGDDAKGPFRFGADRKVRTPRKSKATAASKNWLRRPGETSADWLERTTKTR